MLIKYNSKITQNNKKTHIIFNRHSLVDPYLNANVVVSWILTFLYAQVGYLRPPVTHYTVRKLIKLIIYTLRKRKYLEKVPISILVIIAY